MTRTLVFLFFVTVIGVVVLAGCGLSQQHIDRIATLATENDALMKAQEKLVSDAKTGELDPVKVAQALADITKQIKKNLDEVQKIRSEGNTTAAVIGSIIGMFGRSALHAFAGAIPGGTAVGNVVQMGLQLLLGGSASAAKKEEEED